MAEEKKTAVISTDQTAIITTEGEPSGNPRYVSLPPAEAVVSKASLLLRNRNSRLPEAVATLLEDPVTTLEVFRSATDPTLGQSRSYLATLQGAVIRLGSARVVQTLREISSRPAPANPTVKAELEKLRTFANRTSKVARLLAFHANAGSPDEAQAAGLMTQIGLMVACVYFGPRYIELSQKFQRASLIYRLEKMYGFHVNQFQTLYLASYGLPSGLLIALDLDEQCKTSRQAALRFVVQGSIDLVEAFENGKWEKYAPRAAIPVKSAFRLLQLPEKHHENFYEQATELLNALVNGTPTAQSAEELPAAVAPDEQTVVMPRPGEEPEDANVVI